MLKVSNSLSIMIPDKSYKEFRDGVNKLNKKIYENYKVSKDFEDRHKQHSTNIFVDMIVNNWGKDTWKLITKIISPKINDFNVSTYEELSISSDINHSIKPEIWTESECVFIPFTKAKDFILKLNERLKRSGKNVKID